MTRLTRTWLIMSGLVLLVVMALAVPGLPRLAWIALIMAAALIKGRLILLDYLELRNAASWRGGAVAGLATLLLLMTVLAMA